MKKFLVLAAVGVVACFVALPTPAAAHGIGRYHGWRGYGRSHWSPRCGFFRRGWRTAYCYPGTWAYYAPCTTYYYPAAGAPYYGTYVAYDPQGQPAQADAVTIQMHVPSDARVWIDGDATSQTGAAREFVSPPLTPGREYTYHVRVQWEENGKAVESTRPVAVHAGDRINLNFGT